MHRCLRIYVVECEALIVLMNNVGWNLAINYFLEDRFFAHVPLLLLKLADFDRFVT